MRYNVNQFIILTGLPDSGIWNWIVAEIGDVQSNYYRILPLTIPKNRPTYTTESVFKHHLFADNWIYNTETDLLNLLLERS